VTVGYKPGEGKLGARYTRTRPQRNVAITAGPLVAPRKATWVMERTPPPPLCLRGTPVLPLLPPPPFLLLLPPPPPEF